VTNLFYQDRIIARLQQPYSLDCIPVEAEYQVRFLIIFNFWFVQNIHHSFMNFHIQTENVVASSNLLPLFQKKYCIFI
jgi:hypothetical protein